MIRVAVVGATGYAGAELVRILSGHPDVVLKILVSRQYEGVRFDNIYPAMAGVVGNVCEAFSVDRIAGETDLAFMALPHSLPMQYVPELIARGLKVIDLSADFRFKDAAAYEAAYEPHTAKDLLEKAVYGLSEVYSQEIARAFLVGNPGCYPTSVLLPLLPLVKENIVDTASIVADSKSGVSGAGRSPSLTVHFCEVYESFKAYKVAQHRHNPEMNEVLTREAERRVRITFVPHLIPMVRGMLTTLYVNPVQEISVKRVRDCLRDFYDGSRFIRICQEGRMPNTLHVRGTNFCDIGFTFDGQSDRLILISAIDNLVKGAAGQAVQNMNIMFGLDEKRGLSNIPFPL
jgi:N-acetyl-gamma-glutamyl-phosphate reductase